MSDAQLFGKYRLVRRLAFGGMAEIFLARLVGDQGFEKTLVLKRILPQFSSDPDFTRMFIDEAVLAARLTHTNVAAVYDFGEVDGTYFITMELVDGADLRRIIRGGNERKRALTAVEVAAIGEGMARGLAYVHDLEGDDGNPLGIIHRDISPHNVMITRGGDVKIMDFGIAKAAARATHTATGTIKGKLAYMAPEQALAEEIDQRADQYAVGLTLWESLVGRRVFEGDSEPELMSRVAAGRVRDLRTEKPDVPEELARIVMRMISAKRDARYPDLHQVEHELAAFRFGLGAPGAVRLSGLVDELAPREAPKPVAAQQGTAVLPGAEASQPSQPSVPSQRTDHLSIESGWSHGGATEATRAATPEMVPALPTVLLPKRGRRGVWAVAALATLVVAAGLAAVAARTVGDRRATLMLTSEPAGASVLLEEGGALLATGLVTPATVAGRKLGEVVRYRLELEGYEAKEGAVELKQAEEMGRVVLARRSGKPIAEIADKPFTDGRAPIADEPIADGRRPTADNRPLNADKSERAKSTKADRSRGQAAGVGYLSLRARGAWAEVRINGKLLGTTPLTHVELPAGLTTLQLRSPSGVNETMTVDIPVGGHVQKTIEIR